MAFAKHKQFAKDLGTIYKEGVKVKKLKAQVADRQEARKSMGGTSGSGYNGSNNAAGVIANDPGMFDGGVSKRKSSTPGKPHR